MEFGTQIGNTSQFTGCIGEVQAKNALFAAGMFTKTYKRSLYVDFTYPIMEESVSPFLRKPPPNSRMWDALKPLQWQVWILMIFSTAIVSLFCFIFSKYSPLSAWNLNLIFSIIDEIKLKEHIWNIIGSLFMQGQDFYPFSLSARVVLAVWWIFALIMYAAYSADLTTFLTIQTQETLLSSLSELANNPQYSILIPVGTNIAILFHESTDPILAILNKRIIYIDNPDDCAFEILKPISSNLVCITDTSGLQYISNQNCLTTYMIPDKFNMASIGFVLPKNSAMKPMMDAYIKTLVDNGVMNKWIDDVWGKNNVSYTDCNANNNSNNSAIHLEDLSGVFILTCILFILGFFIFLFEILWIKLCKQSIRTFPIQ